MYIYIYIWIKYICINIYIHTYIHTFMCAQTYKHGTLAGSASFAFLLALPVSLGTPAGSPEFAVHKSILFWNNMKIRGGGAKWRKLICFCFGKPVLIQISRWDKLWPARFESLQNSDQPDLKAPLVGVDANRSGACGGANHCCTTLPAVNIRASAYVYV